MDSININEIDIEMENKKIKEEDENYVIQARICPIISRELKWEEIVYNDEQIWWEPPKEPGLQNSSPIIPQYYHIHKNSSKIVDIDYYEIIKDDIRNFRPLNKYQMKYIKVLSDEYKNEIMELFNECLSSLNELIKL